MADLSSLLAVVEHDPDDVQALEALAVSAHEASAETRRQRFAATRKILADRGRPDVVVRLLAIEIAATDDVDRKVDLLLEKGMVLDGELLDVPAARAAFDEVLALRPNDTMAAEAIGELDLSAQNWQKFAAKYVEEAEGSTDRSLATGLYVSAAETFVRFSPESPEAESYLRKALDIDPRNSKAAFHLTHLFARTDRGADLRALLEQRAEAAGTTEEKVSALLHLAKLARGGNDAAGADQMVRRVLQLDPAQPQALRAVADSLAEAEDWVALVELYQNAVKARRGSDDDLGMVLQIAMLLWKHVGDLDQAEEYFRRVRKIEPGHPAALDFYREYYPAKGEHQKLLRLLRQVEKSPRARSSSDASAQLGVEIAELAEQQNNPEKAIEAWKQLLRNDPPDDIAAQARTALGRLYRRTEKWNALLDLMKDEIDRTPDDDVAGKVAKLHDVVEIYRDKLRLDVMVINTYNAILKIDPDNRRATDELASKFRALGRWNDLIAVLTRKSEAPDLSNLERVTLLREIADLWSERFGNFANAIRPLERILELSPGSADFGTALTQLKEIYTKRRQWRALIDVLGREASVLPPGDKRHKQAEMARLASDRLGDTRLAIEINNAILSEHGPDQAETLASLASLYDREKRWLALAEILHRQVKTASNREAIALYEKLGQVYADRLSAPQAAAEAWQEILNLEPSHARALRTLRELYATAGDFAGLERLYKQLGQEDDLVDALLGIADRLDVKAQRLPLVERAAQLAQQQAEAIAETGANPGTGAEGDATPTAIPTELSSGPLRSSRRYRTGVGDSPAEQALDRARQVWERVLAVESQHVGAASALAPIYEKQEKWAKLITVLEIEIGGAADTPSKLAKLAQIRRLCEDRLTSRTLAFTWTLRAFELDPESEELFADVLRLAHEPEQWSDVATAFEKRAIGDHPVEVKLRLFRELAKIASRRLSDPERARTYHRQVLALAPEDREAEQHLEEISIQLADWPELLASYRRRATREQDPTERASLLIEIASLQEEKLVDLDGAAATYHEALRTLPNQLRALRALSRIEEARGDWESLVEVLAAELEQIADPEARFDMVMRIGGIEEVQLERAPRALVRYREALAIPPSVARGATAKDVRPEPVNAIARIVLGDKLEPAQRIEAARLILPNLDVSEHQARIIEILRNGEDTGAAERIELDRRLMRLYHNELGDPAAAWTVGLRIVGAEPSDAETRAGLTALAAQLGRDGEWAQHLGAALAALKEANQLHDVRQVATELARVAGERLADAATAERAWQTVLSVEPEAADAFEALTAMFRADARWTDLRGLLERRVEVTLDDTVRRAVLLELAALEEDVLGQPAFAMNAHRRVLELDAAYVPSYQALDRLYTTAGQWSELEGLLATQVDHANTSREVVELEYRRAELFANRLGDHARAVELLDDVINRMRTHAGARTLLEQMLRGSGESSDITLRVAKLLEPLYLDDKQWKDLVHVLRAQRTVAAGTEAVELLSRIATIEETELGQPREAFDAWVEVLRLDPTHERARSEISRLAQSLQRWPEATAALEAASEAAPPGDVTTRGALLGELAVYYDTQLNDAPRAIAAYRRLLESDPSNPVAVRKAGTALARLYEDAKDHGELRGVMRKLAEWAEEPDERRALLARVASLEENELGERDAAILTWRDVLADHPTDAGALNALERLYESGQKWRDLIEILHRKVEVATAGETTSATIDEAKGLLARIAHIHEHQLSESEDAISAYLEILDRDPNDRYALGELARLYRAAERHADLLDILERQIAMAPGAAENLPSRIEVARLLAGPLVRPYLALDKWKDVLQEAPTQPDALAAVEAALADFDLRTLAADILRPVYGATAEHDKLAQLQMRAAEWADDPATKLRLLGEVVRLREFQLGDKAGAFAAQLEALRHAAAEPELMQVVSDAERLAGELGREGDLIEIYREVAPNVLDADIQRRLYLDVADLSRAVRQDLELAREYYQKVLDAQPDDRRALAALDSIYRQIGDDDRLVEVLLRQADVAGADIYDRVGALVEAAGLYATLERPDDAIATWEQVLAVAPERRDAMEALEALYRAQGRWPDVVDLYERRLGFATTIDEAVTLRVALGEIHERELRDFETAIDNYSAALSGDQHHQQALAAVERYLIDPDLRVVAAEVLEPIYVGQHRWTDLIRVYGARLESATDPTERHRLTRFVARLYEEQLEDFKQASEWYAKVFREAPDDQSIRDQLQRLASMIDNWEFVATTYQGYLDDEAGDSPEIREIAIAAATIYDRRLGDVDRAFKAYRRALAIISDDAIPDERELVRRLEDLLSRAERWADLVTIYEDVIARGDEALRLEALVKRARMLEQGVGDIERAIEGWRDTVLATEDGGEPAIELAYREAVQELERLYRSREQWRDLVDLLESRLVRAASHPATASEPAELRLTLADVHETQLADVPAAIDQYEQVIEGVVLWERAVAALERLVVHEAYRERIAELLEPVYRQQDWWQKLVVILDAKLDYIRDPFDQVAALHEIATIHEDRGGALDLALAALARAWRIDVADENSLDMLLSLADKLEAWDDTVATIEGGATATQDPDLAAALWARAAEIHEAHRNDLPRAIAAWRKVDEVRPDDVVALAALDRLLALESRTAELVTVVARRAELTEDASVRLVLLHRVAALYEEVLDDRDKAIEAYNNVLRVDDADGTALDALERLYRQALAASPNPDVARDLVQTLERKIEVSTDVAARQDLRHAAATVYEEHLSDIYQAIGHLVAVLDDDAGEPRALAELDRIYAREKMWPELLDIVDRRALLAAAATDRADLAFRAAHLVEHELVDPDAAIPRYGAVLGVLSSHEGARGALEGLLANDSFVELASPILERVYRADGDAAGLVRVYERRIAASPTSDHETNWRALAEVQEQLARDPAAAFAVWSRAIAAMPDRVELLEPLGRLAEGDATGALWRDFAVRLDQLLGEALSSDVEQAYAMRLGQIGEDRLGDLDAAARAYERASAGPDPRPALAALERVLAKSDRWSELAGVLRREADVADSDTQITEYLFRLGDLFESTLSDAASAVNTYREVLSIAPLHVGARAALERMLEAATDQRAQIVEILEPLFESDGDAARLIAVLEARIALTPDPIDRAGLLSRIADLAENQLGNHARALEATLRWLAVDPASGQALNETDRLAERLGQWPEVASRIAEIAAAPEAADRDTEVQVLLLTFLGRIQRKRLGQLDDAAASYRAALVLDPGSLIAIDDLIKILRQKGEAGALAEVLRQRARAVLELPEKRAAYSEIALICERAGDRAGAIAAWREYLDQDDTDRDAVFELAHLYRAAEDKPALIEALQHAARLGGPLEEEKKLRVEIAQLESDTPRAVAAWQAVLDLDPEDLSALGALEQAYAKAGDWIAVGDMQSRRLALANSDWDRVAIHAEIAKIAEEKRDSIDDAIAAWFAALDIDNSHVPAFANLERLLAAAERWHDLVDLLERHAELHAAAGDAKAELAALARAADVWESKLDNPDAAGEILEKILKREPESVAALTRLSRIYERAGDWDKCKATLEQALKIISAQPPGSDAADLFFRLGEVARLGDADDATAVLHFQQALKNDPAHAAAIAALEKLARERRDNTLLADMLKRRVATATKPDERVALLVEIAELERKAGRPESALEALEQARDHTPDDARVLAPLADLYFATDQLDAAAPIYDQLAQDAKAARRMKDVARFRQRQGGILEARGDRAAALTAYEEALRVNPTDVTTMTGLGRLYFAAADWEKARRIYQSLVLQNIDEDAGVTKGEVYLALGTIHLQLGQPPKAKSMFQRGLEIEPHNPKLREALSSLTS